MHSRDEFPAAPQNAYSQHQGDSGTLFKPDFYYLTDAATSVF